MINILCIFRGWDGCFRIFHSLLFFPYLISQDKVYGWIIIGCISCLGSHGYCENFNSHFLFFYIFSVASQTKFFFLIYHLFMFFQIKDGFAHMGFGLCAAGTPGLDFRKNTKKKSSAKKLHRADSSPTAYDWFSILSLSLSLSYIHIYMCVYVCMLLSWHICTWLSSMVPTGL